ncbi:MAG: class I SAM-dependent methyltransferase [Leptolyngbya sp. SIO3F4]|nr:class I SAM-dependent methyltransferase [Leptolyngbya sp. SIO3F4]
MLQLIKAQRSNLRQILPEALLGKSSYLYSALRKSRIRKSQQRFERHLKSAPQSPLWLDLPTLESLNQKYPVAAGKIEDHINTSERRSQSRANNILQFTSGNSTQGELKHFLELGCGDGTVSYFLQTQGKNTTAVDSCSDGFSEKAFKEGVNLREMDAAALEFETESFDLIFSYDSFEHFLDPELVLQEAIRVLKPGGYLYLQFEPLYMSPFGLHSWELVNIPYCHLLFPKDLLQEFCGEKGQAFFSKMDTAINQWRLEQFRSLWQRYSSNLKVCKYNEIYTIEHLNLIDQYPMVFATKTDSFDDLVCSRIEVIFQKQ